MNIHDAAREFARRIQETDEYKACTAARDAAYADDTNRQLLEEHKRLQQSLQAGLALGRTMDADDLSRFQQITNVLQYNPDTSAFMIAQFRLQTMMADIYKILAEAAGFDLDFLGNR